MPLAKNLRHSEWSNESIFRSLSGGQRDAGNMLGIPDQPFGSTGRARVLLHRESSGVRSFPCRRPDVLTNLHSKAARGKARRIAPSHDDLAPFAIQHGLQIRVGSTPFASPSSHPSHVLSCHDTTFMPRLLSTRPLQSNAQSQHSAQHPTFFEAASCRFIPVAVKAVAANSTCLSVLRRYFAQENRGAQWPSYKGRWGSSRSPLRSW